VLHCLVPLEPGRQVLRAQLGAEWAELAITRLDASRDVLPEGRLGTAVHGAEVEARCQGCHQLHETERPDAGLALDGPCLSCHPLLSRLSLHGPVKQGACLACHDNASAPRFAVRWPIEDGCFACHQETKQAIDLRSHRHGPAVAGRCTVCHDAHGGSAPSWLTRPTFELCTGCHVGQRAGRHVLAGFVNSDSHPVDAWLDGGARFTCSSCHESHAAQSVALYRFGAVRKEALCLACHPY
jgi:predicted CXXCH cytochrome family protein